MPIAKEILNMLDLGRKAITNHFSCFFTLKIQKTQRISVPPVQWLYIIPFDGYRWPNRIEASLCGYPTLVYVAE